MTSFSNKFHMLEMNEIKEKYHCSRCNYRTLDDGPGCFDICPVCYWEDDDIQRDDPNYKGGANDIIAKSIKFFSDILSRSS